MTSPLSPPPVELDAEAGRAIAEAMRQVAALEGNHPRELALIAEFERELPGEAVSEIRFDALHSPELRATFVHSVVLVAFADGSFSQAEGDLIRSWLPMLGMSDADLADATRQVASVLLSSFAGVRQYRDQIVSVGRDLGLEDQAIDSILG